MRYRVHGFTLVELVVVMAIAAIMLGLGLPSFRSLMAGQKVKTLSGDFVVAANFARSEAIKRNKEVSMTSEAGGWKDGWTIKQDAMVLGKQPAYEGVSTTSSVTEIIYLSTGRMKPPADVDTQKLQADGAKLQIEAPGATPRCVSFALSGLPKSRVLKEGETCS